MFKAVKNKRTQMLLSEIQADAFKKQGWTISKVEEKAAPDKPPVDELAALKAEADAIGMKYHHAIGAEKLSEQIAEFKVQLAQQQEKEQKDKESGNGENG